MDTHEIAFTVRHCENNESLCTASLPVIFCRVVTFRITLRRLADIGAE
jgi:hypothetical protein